MCYRFIKIKQTAESNSLRYVIIPHRQSNGCGMTALCVTESEPTIGQFMLRCICVVVNKIVLPVSGLSSGVCLVSRSDREDLLRIVNYSNYAHS